MIVSGSLKCEKSHVGMQKKISKCIASVDGKCYDSARARVESKFSDTEEVNSGSSRFSQSRYVGRYCCVNRTTTSQQLLKMAKM